MTTQQEQIKNNLISLVKKGVRIIFNYGLQCCGEAHKTEAFYDKVGRVSLVLSDQSTLETWEEEIQKAEHMEAMRVLGREHDYNHADFFKAINAFIDDLKLK